MVTRKRKRSVAFSRAGTGQFSPGALSRASSRTTTRTVAPSVGGDSPFVTVGGQSGQLRDPNQDVFTKAKPTEIGQSSMFAAKLAEGQPPASAEMFGASMEGGFSSMERSGIAGTIQSEQQPGFIPGSPESVEGRGNFQNNIIDELNFRSFQVIEGVLNLIENMGNGDFARGVGQLITLPLTMGSSAISGTEMAFYSKVIGKSPGELGSIGKQLLYANPGTIAKATIKTGKGKVASIARKTTENVKTMNTIKSVVSKVFTKEKISRYVTDGGNIKYKTSMVSRITPRNVLTAVAAAGSVAAAAAYLYLNGQQSRATGFRDVEEELKGYLAMITRDMNRDGNYELGNVFAKMTLNVSGDAISAMPGGKGSIQGASYFNDIMNKTIPMLQEHYKNMAEMEQEGLTPEENANFWEEYNARVQANITAEVQIRTDYNNAERQKIILWELEARQNYNDSKLAAERSAYEAAGAYWAKQRILQAEFEAAERIRVAEYWLEYKKLVQKLQDESRPSKLNFGII